jgi:hypothetical protein
MSINYRDEMELGVPDDDPELIAEIHACYAQIHELEAKIKERDAEVEALKTALRWYADRKNLDKYIGTSEHHTPTDHWFNCWMMMPVTNVARKALGMKTETEEILHGRSDNKRGM